MNRSAQLDALITSLNELIEVLSLDSHCQWRRHFEQCLLEANYLKSLTHTQENLNELSGSVRYVFGGMGSFNDYVPLVRNSNGSFSGVCGMENLEAIATAVYANALALMVVDGGQSRMK